METLREQLELGGWCIHGTQVGTPGGADLVCRYCEDNWTWEEFQTMVKACRRDWRITQAEGILSLRINRGDSDEKVLRTLALIRRLKSH